MREEMMVSLGGSPNKWKTGACNYGSLLTLQIVKRMLEAGEKEADKQKVPMSMAISDAGGNLLAFRRMDNAALFSIQISIDKAYTAVFGKMATGKFGEMYHSGGLVPLFFHNRWITFNGGYPILKDDILVGGLGVSGGVIEDVRVAKTMLKAGQFSTREVDEFIASNETQGKNKSK
jgi:uncharacterized protein GlcG (DUF336 family)